MCGVNQGYDGLCHNFLMVKSNKCYLYSPQSQLVSKGITGHILWHPLQKARKNPLNYQGRNLEKEQSGGSILPRMFRSAMGAIIDIHNGTITSK